MIDVCVNQKKILEYDVYFIYSHSIAEWTSYESELSFLEMVCL